MESKIMVLKVSSMEELIEQLDSLFSSGHDEMSSKALDEAKVQFDTVPILEKALDLILEQSCLDCMVAQNKGKGSDCESCVFQGREYFINLAKEAISLEKKKQQEEKKQFDEKVEQLMSDIKDLFYHKSLCLDKEFVRIIAGRLIKQGWVKQSQEENSQKSDV